MNDHLRPIIYSVLMALVGIALACGVSSPGASPDVTRTAAPSPPLEAAATSTPQHPLWEQATAWQPAGFGGAGNFDGVFFDPNQAGVVYAPSDVTGVFRSTDNGDHWEMRSTGLGNYEVSSFAVDPFDSSTLYAGAGAISTSNKSGIYVSHDAGLSWQHLTSTFTHTITFRRWRTINAIAPDPVQQGYLLSGSRLNGIWHSTDSGNTWTQVYSAPLTSAPQFTHYDDDPPDPHPAPVSIVIFDPVTPTTVYAGFDGGGAIKSWDSGLTWEPITNGLPAEATVKYLAVGSGDDVLYAAVGEAGVYKSTDGGGWWDAVNNFPPTVTLGADAWVSSVAVNPGDPDIAYLTLTTYNYPSVWKTTDGGATWTPTGDVTVDPVNDPTEAWSVNFPGDYYWPYTWSWQITLDPHNSNRLFFVNFWDVLRSDDGGAHWFTKIAGAQNTCVTNLVLDANTLYATHWDAGLLRSANQGLTWTAVLPSTVNDPALSGHYWNLAIAQNGGTKYYYTTSDAWARGYGQVLRSTDGISWTVVFTNPRPTGAWMSGQMLGLAVDPATPSTLYVTQDGGQVWQSTNNGDAWAPTTGQPGVDRSFTYALAVNDQHRIFAGTLRDGLWRSTNGGDSWEQVLTDQATIYHLLAVPGAVYASAGDANLYRSVNGGDTWQNLTNFTSVDDGDGVGEQGMAIAVDPQNPNHILFSRQDTWHSVDASPGLVESADGGDTWAPINAGLRNLNVSALSIGSGGDIFAGTACGGIWRRPASASTSHSVYLPLVVRNFGSPPPSSLSAVDDLLYQLQNIDLAAMGNTAYDLVVIDYSSDGSEATKFTAAQIAALKHSPGGEKIVLSYMSIGEAETYRFYWQDNWDANHDGIPDPGAPGWLDIENPNWPGNYKVRYWDPAWQTIIFGYTDKLLDAGFDGAYMDIIDAYQYYADQGRATAAQEMADFVAAIAAHARARDPDFYLFPQNAAELASLVPAYLNVVNGIGQEDTYYGYDADDVATPVSVTQYLETYLDVFKNAGKLVLTIDYATTPAHIDDAYAKSQARGYVPFVTVRALDQLTINPGHAPD